MASIDFNPLLPRFGRVVLRRRGDKVFFCRAPVRSGPLPVGTARQAVRFGEAAAYAKRVLGVPARRALYEAAAEKNRQSVFIAALSDFIAKPVIRDLKADGYHGHAGDVLAVLTRADLNLAMVHVALRRTDGTVVEEGDAVFVSGEYRYTATQDVPTGTALFADVTVRDIDAIEVKRSVPLSVA